MAARSGSDGFAPASGLDPEGLRAEFAESGIVQISPFLADDGAGRLRGHLAGRTDWRRALKTAAGDFEHDLAAGGLSAAQLEAMTRLAGPGAGSDFRYAYDRILAVDRQEQRRDSGTLLARFADFLNARPLRGLLASICGEAEIAFVETQATRYCPGHFLTMHHDAESGTRRRVAYVLGLTEGWRPEYGGLLLFHDRTGEVVRGLVPRMNVLTLFKVPRIHSVSLVASYAAAPRYSITGWLDGPAEDDAAPVTGT